MDDVEVRGAERTVMIRTVIRWKARSTALLNGVDAARLNLPQSKMESTHRPPSMGPALSFPALNLGYSWTIFDQEIISLVNPPWLFEVILVGGAG